MKKIITLLVIFLSFLFTGCASHKLPPTNQVANSKQKIVAENISWLWPVSGKIVHTFGSNQGKNKGIDISGKKNTPVYAVAAGKIVYCGPSLHSYGGLIILKHNNEFVSVYSHVKNLSVKDKEIVTAGKKIAEVTLNKQNRAILHFEIRRNGVAVDPFLYIETKK